MPKILSLALCMLGSSVALAQAPGPSGAARPDAASTIFPAETQVLSLAEAVAAARQHVPSVLNAVGQAQVADAQVALARAALLPSLSGTLTGAGLAQNTSVGGSAAACAPGTVTCSAGSGFYGSVYGDATVKLSWTLWDFGRTGLNVKAADLTALGARADVATAERVAITAAATAYYALLADEEAVAASQQTLRQRERELDIARRRVAIGTNPPIDQTRAEIAAQSARLDLATAEATVLNDAASLSVALGLDPGRPLRATPPPEVAIDDDPAHAADTALKSRPEVAAARYRAESGVAGIGAARAAWRPSVTAAASAGARYTQYDSYGTGVGATSETASANLALLIPIFDPTIRPNTRIAEGNALSARAQLKQQELQVRSDAVQAAIAVRSARQQLDLAARNVDLNAANLKLAEGRYAAGTAQLIDLVDAQAQDATARLTAIQRRFQWERAKVSLLGSIGRLADLEQR